MKNGGHFLLADYFPAESIAHLEGDLAKHFEIVKSQDITQHVLKALDESNDKKKKIIKNNFPWYVRYFLYNISGVKHSDFYN